MQLLSSRYSGAFSKGHVARDTLQGKALGQAHYAEKQI